MKSRKTPLAHPIKKPVACNKLTSRKRPAGPKDVYVGCSRGSIVLASDTLSKAMEQSIVTLKNLRAVSGIGDEGAEQLMRSLRNSNVTTLDLGQKDIFPYVPLDNYVTCGGARWIAGILSCNGPLTSLCLAGNHISHQGATLISKTLKTNSTLTHINLAGNHIGDKGAGSIAEALAKSTSITHLHLGHNNIGNAGSKRIATSLEQNRVLVELNLSINRIDYKAAAKIALALTVNATLTKLDLHGNELGDQGAMAFATTLTKRCALKQLILSACRIHESGFEHISNALVRNNHLTSLDLRGNFVLSEVANFIAKALEKNKSLAFLNLGSTEIGAGTDGDVYVKQIAEALVVNEKLIHLDMSSCYIDDRGVGWIASALERNHILETLNLYNNRLTVRGVEHISAALHQNTALTELDIGRNELQAVGVKKIFAAFAKNHTLQSLGLRGLNDLWTVGEETRAFAEQVAAGLENNTTLTSLNLECNSLNDLDVNFLGRALTRNSTLNTLKLGANPISDQGAKDLLRAIRNNTSLTRLDLCCRQGNLGISDPVANQIDAALAKNKIGTKICQCEVVEDKADSLIIRARSVSGDELMVTELSHQDTVRSLINLMTSKLAHAGHWKVIGPDGRTFSITDAASMNVSMHRWSSGVLPRKRKHED